MSGLNHHNSTTHKANYEYKCKLWNWFFSTKLTEHKRISYVEANNEGQSECSDCGKRFTTKRNLIRYLKEVHRYTTANFDYAPEDSTIIKCNKCEQSFLRETNMKKHKETVHGSGNTQKKGKCPSFGQEFSGKDNLTHHMKKNICYI